MVMAFIIMVPLMVIFLLKHLLLPTIFSGTSSATTRMGIINFKSQSTTHLWKRIYKLYAKSSQPFIISDCFYFSFSIKVFFFQVWFPFEVSKGTFALVSSSFLALGTGNWPLVFNVGMHRWCSGPALHVHCASTAAHLTENYFGWSTRPGTWRRKEGFDEVKRGMSNQGKKKKEGKDWEPQGIEKNFVCLLIQWTMYVSHLWLENLGWQQKCSWW